MQKSFVGAAPLARLVAVLTGTPATFTVDNASGFPTGANGPFPIVLDRTTPTEEKVLCSSLGGNTFTVQTRGWDGTATSDHGSGTTVEHCIDADTIQEANSHVNNDARDDHSQYFNGARHDVHEHPANIISPLSRLNLDSTASIPIGTLVMNLSANFFPGWLTCDGSVVSRAAYPLLFELIAENFGAGDGSTTFNLPDMRSYFPVMGATNANGGLTPHSIGTTGGEELHTLTSNELAAHSHTPGDPGASSSGPSEFITGPNNSLGGAGGSLNIQAMSVGSNFLKVDYSANTAQSGGGAAHNNMPPWFAVNFLVKAT